MMRKERKLRKEHGGLNDLDNMRIALGPIADMIVIFGTIIVGLLIGIAVCGL